MIWLNKGLALGGTALGGVSSTLTGLFVDPENYLDEVSHQDNFLYKYKEQASDLSRVSSTLEVTGRPQSAGANYSQIDSNINKHYFGAWRALSEGPGDALYLIDNQDKFHRIDVKNHGSDTKLFWGGRKIVKDEYWWFGPRQFPFDAPEGGAKKEKPLDTMRNLLNLLKQQSKDELQELSKFLDARSDDQLCEILDVFWKCWMVKRKFVRDKKTLQSEIDFNLEVVSTELTKVSLERNLPTDSEWNAFASIFKNMVKFNKLMIFQNQVAKYGMEWAKRRLSSDSNSRSNGLSSTGNYDSIRDPVHYWLGILKNDKLGYDCSAPKTLFKDFFEECSSTLTVEKAETRVTHVLKSGSKCCSADKRTFRISKKGGGVDSGRWWGQHGLTPNSSSETEFLKQANTRLVIEGIVEEECKLLYPGWLFAIPSVEGRFCHEVNKMFFGDTVNEKRFCRYEIPNARGYLRAHRFNMFTIPKWTKGNAFWAQCHANGH